MSTSCVTSQVSRRSASKNNRRCVTEISDARMRPSRRRALELLMATCSARDRGRTDCSRVKSWEGVLMYARTRSGRTEWFFYRDFSTIRKVHMPEWINRGGDWMGANRAVIGFDSWILRTTYGISFERQRECVCAIFFRENYIFVSSLLGAVLFGFDNRRVQIRKNYEPVHVPGKKLFSKYEFKSFRLCVKSHLTAVKSFTLCRSLGIFPMACSPRGDNH